MRHSRQRHCNKSKMQEPRPKKDKPPSRISNRIAKFTRDFSWGKFGFFYSAPNIEILVFRTEGVGCRSPPRSIVLKNFKFDGLEEIQVKNTPRKVFIIEDGKYTEITYDELCRQTKNKSDSYTDKLFIPLHGILMEVTKEDYTDFYKTRNHQKYLKRRSAANGDISYDMLTTDDFNGEDILIADDVDIAVKVEKKIMMDKLKESIRMLSENEQELLDALYFNELSERDWSKISGIPQKTVNYRKRRILAKLKKLLES